jgi:hypothetical protein
MFCDGEPPENDPFVMPNNINDQGEIVIVNVGEYTFRFLVPKRYSRIFHGTRLI